MATREFNCNVTIDGGIVILYGPSGDALLITGTAPAAVGSGGGSSAGAALTITGATGGATAATSGAVGGGNGGGSTITGGVGGAETGATGAVWGGAGGVLAFHGGIGGAAASTAGSGGLGGPSQVFGGTGGASTAATGTTVGGIGGDAGGLAGAGGAAASTSGTGGTGGTWGGTAGVGGAATGASGSTVGGLGGPALLAGGAGGTVTSASGTRGSGGPARVYGGKAATGTGTGGTDGLVLLAHDGSGAVGAVAIRKTTAPPTGCDLDTNGPVAVAGVVQLTQSGSATGSTNGPTTTSGTYADLAEMSVTLTTSATADILVSFDGDFSATNTFTLGLRLVLDGTPTGTIDNPHIPFASGQVHASIAEHRFAAVGAGSHTVKVQWNTSGGTMTAVGTNRSMTVKAAA